MDSIFNLFKIKELDRLADISPSRAIISKRWDLYKKNINPSVCSQRVRNLVDLSMDLEHAGYGVCAK